MKIRFMLLAGALLATGGTSRADIAGVVVYCAPGLNASGKEVIKCTKVPPDGSADPGTGGWQEPDPGWTGSDGIAVITATYGWNCGASLGNATYDLGTACDGASSCSYTVDFNVLGDPAPGCAKTFTAAYTCPGTRTIRHGVYVAAEAGFDKMLTMSCQ